MPFLRNRSQLVTGIALLVAFLFANAALAYRQTVTLHDNATWVLHTYEVLRGLDELLVTVTNAETGQRGYLLTGERRYLTPHAAAVADFPPRIGSLIELTADNPQQQVQILRLKELISSRLKLLEQGIALQDNAGFAEARDFLASHRGYEEMNEIRLLIETMQQVEQTLLNDRKRANDAAYRTAIVSTALAVLLGLATVAVFVTLLGRTLRSLEDSSSNAQRQRELLEATLSSIGDAVIATDTDGKITFLNVVAQSLTGWAQSEAHGRPVEEVFHIVDEMNRDAIDYPASGTIRRGRIAGLPDHAMLLARDGTEWPIDDCAAPIRDRQGNLNGAIYVFREIRERRRQEEELRRQTAALQEANTRQKELLRSLKQSESRLRMLADSIPHLAWMTRPDGYILWYNERWYQYTGKTPEETQGWGWQSVHDPGELPRVLDTWKAALAGGEPWEEHFPLRRHDGAMRWHLTRAVPFRDEQGGIAGWFGTNTDITDHLQLEDALRDSNRRKDEFLAMLAHELRNPLAPISNSLQVWPMVQNDRAQMEQLRLIMDRQVRQMTRLIDDLLDVSRITRGKIELRRQPVDLSITLHNAVESLESLIAENDHRLHVTLPPEPLIVDGDVARLTQLFGNILHNAVKYTGRQGQIDVTAGRDHGMAVVRIRDNGPGIPRHMLASIFEMFQQVDLTMNRAQGGLGIGLSLVKRLVEMHGGQVEAQSDGPGTGSEFIVSLPLATIDPEPDGAQQPSDTLPIAALPRLRILVVDDVQASAKTLALMLESIGQTVAVFHDGLAALERIVSDSPDLVFLDIAMPGMDGYQIAESIRQHAQLKSVVLVALTGYGQENDRRRAIEAGFNHHMTKPTSMDALERLLCLLADPSSRTVVPDAGSVSALQPK